MCCERPISISLSLARHFQQPPPYHVPHPSPAVFVCVCVCVIVCVSALPAACAPWTVFRHAQVCAYVCAWCFPSDIPSPPSSRSHSLPLALRVHLVNKPSNTFLLFCLLSASSVCGRSRGIFATRNQMRGVSTIYGHHFPAARVSARTRLRVRACLCTGVF